jgi:hypothetical protein
MRTQKIYCGHWSDDDLSRTLSLKLEQLDKLRREQRDLEGDIIYIQNEQRERFRLKVS